MAVLQPSERAWSYHPKASKSVTLEECVKEFSPLVASATNNSRKSCFFTHNIEEARKFLPSYAYVNGYLWKDYPLAAKLKEEIEKKFHTQFDYVLFHIYEDGEANIGWHNDKESLYEEIISVSYGQSRKFRIKTMGRQTGWDDEYRLGNGDVFHMHAGCQLKFVHTVPKELTVKGVRVNWTFRKFDLRALIHRELTQ
jgi:hypothetical protein